MLNEIFYWVVNVSVLGTVAGLLVFCIRAFRRFPGTVAYALWIAVFIRFALPFMVTSNFSIMNVLTLLGSRKVVVYDNLLPVLPDTELSSMNSVQLAQSYFPFVLKESSSNVLTGFFNTAAVVWAIAASACLLTLLALYLLTKKEIRRAAHYRDNIYICEAVGTPTVYGIFRPKIILPRELPEDQLVYILAHEKVHIRRDDNLRRMFALVVCCLHWFNPFVWLFLKAFLKDMETSCDRAAIKKLDSEDRKAYAHTLLDFAPAKRTLVSNTFTGTSIRLRVENVLSFKRMSLLSAAALAAATAAIAYALMTNPV